MKNNKIVAESIDIFDFFFRSFDVNHPIEWNKYTQNEISANNNRNQMI